MSAPPRSAGARLCGEERGQITVLVALFMALVLIVGACAVDVGLVYLSFGRFRNATDAAALAGANERQLNAASGTVGAESVVRHILQRHGYVDDAATDFTVTFVTTADGESVKIDAARRQDMYFLRFFGMPQVSFGTATAAAIGGSPLDVVLSVDVTTSMDDVEEEMPVAVKAFVDAVNPSTARPNGPQVSLIVYAGRIGDTQRDGQVAAFLTQDKALLDRLADDTGSGACPLAWPSPQPSFATQSNAADVKDRVCPVSPTSKGSGTYVGNGFELAIEPAYNWSVFSAANGGRPGVKKVLINMTDGNNGAFGKTEAETDAETLVAAANVKRGDDNVSGTSDDVEIYTIFLGSSKFSKDPPKCPAAVLPAGPSAIDTMLINASSSTPGSCDHYFALEKVQVSNLVGLFRTIANEILRSRLIQ